MAEASVDRTMVTWTLWAVVASTETLLRSWPARALRLSVTTRTTWTTPLGSPATCTRAPSASPGWPVAVHPTRLVARQ